MGNLQSKSRARAGTLRKKKNPASTPSRDDDVAAATPPPATLSAVEDPALTIPCSIRTDDPEPQLDVIKSCSMAGLPYNPKQYGPPKPACNEERARTVTALNLMDAPPNGELDNILKLVQNIFKTPAALVALFDDTRIYVRNGRGFAEGDFPWRWSFCAWTLASVHHQTMVIEDALQDVRFADNAVAREYGIRFYCGAPLIASNGHRLGTICFIDTKPRKMDPLSCQILNNFAELVVRELEKDIAIMLREEESQALQAVYSNCIRTLDCLDAPVLFTDTSHQPWQLLYTNQAFENISGVSRSELVNAALDKLFGKSDAAQIQWADMGRLAKDMAVFEVEGVSCSKVPGRTFTLTFRPAGQEVLDEQAPIVAGMPSFVKLDFSTNRQYYFINVREESGPNSARSLTKRMPNLLLPDRKLLGLELGALLGSGAQGRVYYGTWFGTNVAVKVIEAQASQLQCRGTNEAVLTGELSHPNIVRLLKTSIVEASSCSQSCSSSADSMPVVFDNGSSADTNSSKGSVFSSEGNSSQLFNSSLNGMSEVWMVMEFCDRGSLQDAIDRGWLRADPQDVNAPPNDEVVIATALELASALQYLHSKGVIHGDLSSFNVLLSSTGPGTGIAHRGFIAKVADFGLSRVLDLTSAINTHTYGTITHMPPELIEDGTLSKAADVYAFGVLLWQMTTGSRPWANLNHAQIMQAVISEHRQLVFPEGTLAGLAAVGAACMSHKAAERPSMEEVCRRLEELHDTLAADVKGAVDLAEEEVPSMLEANAFLQSL